MRLIYLATLTCLAAQANAALVSVTDGTTLTVTECSPMSYLSSTDVLANATNSKSPASQSRPPGEGPPKADLLHPDEETSTGTNGSSPDETTTEDEDGSGSVLSRPAERSIAGLIGFFIVSLVML